MSEEVKDGAEESAKTKKVNKLSLDQLNKKMAALEESKQTGSKYYKSLVLRKTELSA